MCERKALFVRIYRADPLYIICIYIHIYIYVCIVYIFDWTRFVKGAVLEEYDVRNHVLSLDLWSLIRRRELYIPSFSPSFDIPLSSS